MNSVRIGATAKIAICLADSGKYVIKKNYMPFLLKIFIFQCVGAHVISSCFFGVVVVVASFSYSLFDSLV